jgi:hypothetical protein
LIPPLIPPSNQQETEPMLLESPVEVAEEKIDEPLPPEIQQPSVAAPEPQWMKLASLASLPKSLEAEVSQLLPIYTMQFRSCTAESEIYVAHTQICSLLGFTSQEFFEKCTPSAKLPHLISFRLTYIQTATLKSRKIPILSAIRFPHFSPSHTFTSTRF